MGKPSLAVFKFSSCAGCQLQILNLEEYLLDILGVVDLPYFVMARRETAPGPYDIGLVEGAVTSPEEIAKIKDVRRQSKMLVAMGTCACFGGLPSIKNWLPERDVEARVYSDTSVITSTKAFGIGEYVPVDAFLRGCPVDKDELVEFLKASLLGIKPMLRAHSVCVECKFEENVCLFTTKKEVCLGPVTCAGCGALCPSLGRACHGCRGPSDDPNAPSLARTMWELGLDKEDIARHFRRYAGEAPSMREGAEAV